MRSKNIVKQAQWIKKQSLMNKKEFRKFWLSLCQRIGLTLMRQHCSLLQSLTMGEQLFTSVERRLTSFGSHWPCFAMQMGHRSVWSSILAEQSTLWHSIDRIQIREDSVTVITRQHGWHLCYLKSEILPIQCDYWLILPKGTFKNLTSSCTYKIRRSFYLSTTSVATTLNTLWSTSDWSFLHQTWPSLSNCLMSGSFIVSKPTIAPCSVNGPWNLILSERRISSKSISVKLC